MIRSRRLQCPDCQTALVEDLTAFLCNTCSRTFPVEDGVAVLLSARLSELATSEIRYWNDRAAQEFPEGAGEFYRSNFFAQDPWGQYSYGPLIRQLPKDAPILELGAGTVAKSVHLALYDGYQDITVSDIAQRQLAINRSFCLERGIADRVRHVAAEMTSLPFPSGAFAAVFVHSALHHIPDVAAAISEMARCVRPGGVLVVGHEPNMRVHRLVRSAADRLRLSERYHSTLFSEADDQLQGIDPGTLRIPVERAGLRVQAVLPEWLTMGLVHPLPLCSERLLHRTIKVPEFVVRASRDTDAVLLRLPGLRRLSFYFSLVARRPA